MTITIATLADIPADFVTNKGMNSLREEYRGAVLVAEKIANSIINFVVATPDAYFDNPQADIGFANFISTLGVEAQVITVGLTNDKNRIGQKGAFTLAIRRSDFDAWAEKVKQRIDIFLDKTA